MSNLYWLIDEQMRGFGHTFPRAMASHGSMTGRC